MQRAGGMAALNIAFAHLAASPYFVVLVTNPGVVGPVQKPILLRDRYISTYLLHAVSFELGALGLVVVTLPIYQRLKEFAPSWVLLHRDSEVSEAYDVNSTPSAVMVGSDGTIQSELVVGGPEIRKLLSSRAKKKSP